MEKGRVRVKMPTAQSQRTVKRRKKDFEAETVDSLPKYEMHQGPEPQDFLENTRPSFFENLMGIQERTRREDVVHKTEQDVHGSTGHYSLYKNNAVLDEDQIRGTYRFKLPVLMQTLENDNNYLHFNEGFL